MTEKLVKITLRVKTWAEVEIAKKESNVYCFKSNNSNKVLLTCMLAALNISEGIKNGKVNTIVVPANFNALMMKIQMAFALCFHSSTGILQHISNLYIVTLVLYHPTLPRGKYKYISVINYVI